ncbi:hypothetical protein VSDG_06623 [Cytospora chrysosperma]|uniref:dolichol kinase n=1 Tax=Cytospora chrysosperma TaxID=252740 RepID=A0A423VNX3_CYTCH|nr:hypothetical protein VSDG_06623 [Valsa sordida]
MSDNPDPPRASATSNDLIKDKENLRGLSRTPKPYHRQKWELLEPSDRIAARASSIATHRFDDVHDQLLPSPAFTNISTPTTDSGTEADDENLVKRLPAPKARLHKGLRAVDVDLDTIGKSKGRLKEEHKRFLVERTKRNKEVTRRGSEVLILAGLTKLVISNPDVQTVVATWRNVIRWGIALARVPKWRFQRVVIGTKRPPIFKTIMQLFSLKRLKVEFGGSETEDSAGLSGCTTDEDDIKKTSVPRRKLTLPRREGLDEDESLTRTESIPLSHGNEMRTGSTEDVHDFALDSRRHSLPFVEKLGTRSKNYTPSGRRKRSASSSVRSFFSLTQSQATTRKWMYAAWLYICIVGIILGAVRTYVQYFALGGHEPIGWALGYLFGDIPWFRFQVVQANLERWICLTTRLGDVHEQSCHQGWVQHLRHASAGEANTRLFIAAYWVLIIVVGLAVVFRLSQFYEVDTRRKVFHFMMVAMFLPSIYIDPTWCALALALALAIFLLLDLLRASQLPPLSKPITIFLHPYTDGRDHCGPVVISHIFLLIGCAIPLWLSLASLPRTGSGHMRGWEVPTRELSMVAGVVCVGLGDAAASLIGRRYGHHKWLWKGGKSLEGSVAFSVAVFFGLLAANIWLKVGGWPITSQPYDHRGETQGFDSMLSSLLEWDWMRVIRDTSLCATTASLTEAVLTGGNDNVVVPVVLWTCVKSTGL